MRKQKMGSSEPFINLSCIVVLIHLITISNCTSENDMYYHSNSVFYEDCPDSTGNINNFVNYNNATQLTKCIHRGSDMDTENVPQIEKNLFPSHPEGLIPLIFNDHSDVNYLSKFSANEFLDKIFGRRIFNTTMNVIVPIFHVVLPSHAASGSTLHLAMQATLGLFSLAAWAITVIVPSLFTYIIPFGYRSFSGRAITTISEMSHLNNKKFNDISEKVGLDWNTCLQKTVCEAHRSPKEYGIIATLFKIFFPAPFKFQEVTKEFNSPTKYAAKVGSQDSTDCKEKFRCFFDILELVQYLFDWGYYNYLST